MTRNKGGFNVQYVRDFLPHALDYMLVIETRRNGSRIKRSYLQGGGSPMSVEFEGKDDEGAKILRCF